MSDSSSYEPDDTGSDYESESDFDHDEHAVRSIERKTRSNSRAVSVSVKDEQEDISTFDFAEYVGDDMNPDARQDRVRSLQARLQAIPRESINAYNKLLVEMEKDVALKNMDEHPELLTVEQYGAVIWTATEKELFFNMLDRKGKNGIKEIAAAIPTKSELEVMHYIDLLHEGLAKQHLQSEHNATLLMGDYPGAAEVSEECEEKLDELADVMCKKEEAESSWASRDRYHKYGIITEASARELVEAEVNPPLRGGIDKAANVLNVPVWLQLSRKLFMNLGGRRVEDNWIYHKSFSAESPSMTGDALMDFYALTMSITRRLVQSSLFFAMSRVRAMEPMASEEIQSVRTRDVKAALDTLNMTYDRGNLLVDFARQNGILIKDIRNRKGWKPRVLDYDEVERILSLDDDEYEEPGLGPFESEVDYDEDDDYDGEDEEEEDPEEKEEVDQPVEQAQGEEPAQKPQNHEPEPEPELESESEPQPPPPPQLEPELEAPLVQPHLLATDQPLPRQRRYSEGSYQSSSGEEQDSDAEEVHAAHVDQEYDRREEVRLWQTLNQPIPPLLELPIVPEEEMGEDSKDRPFVVRRTREDMVDWRERTLYRAEWEEFGDIGSELEEDLQENRRKRRRIEAEEAAYRSGRESRSEQYDVFEDSEEEDGQDQEGEGGQEPVPISASVVNSDDDEGDPMEVDEARPKPTVVVESPKPKRTVAVASPKPKPTVAVELPKYGSAAWDAFLQKLTSQRTESQT
ncbi:uncharacterized protein N7498_010361 [Penicillium cinerascens]|uniref:Myb-like domain-containing protein n=1 Tax=Penicillium cinerascens TaxID=70096 RepID=A0A9W9J8U4_9EURO|nr:uncharacterized protein N7498_010361 [Penicillium cinerascens]KAJ5191376.1 hypothetical protein N7498_010361 [Penicillium cinerascens]